MLHRKRMGFGGLVVGVSILVMFVVTDTLDIGGHSREESVESLAVAPVDGLVDSSVVSPADRERRCTGLLNAAKGVMMARQAEAARGVVAEVLEPLGKDGEMMLAIAYGYPVHGAAADKEKAIVEFAEGVHAKCLSVVAS